MSKRLKTGRALKAKVETLEDIFDITVSEEARYASLIPFCREFLEAFDFKVAPEVLKADYKLIRNMPNLIDYFYNRFKYLHSDKKVPAKNDEADRGTAKRFIEARINASGSSREKVIAECAEIIDVVLSNTAKFELVFSIGFRMFGQTDMIWVTDKAIAMMNKVRFDETPEYTKYLQEEANKEFKGPHGITHLIKGDE
jgi:hypothetical protein